MKTQLLVGVFLFLFLLLLLRLHVEERSRASWAMVTEEGGWDFHFKRPAQIKAHRESKGLGWKAPCRCPLLLLLFPLLLSFLFLLYLCVCVFVEESLSIFTSYRHSPSHSHSAPPASQCISAPPYTLPPQPPAPRHGSVIATERGSSPKSTSIHRRSSV